MVLSNVPGSRFSVFFQIAMLLGISLFFVNYYIIGIPNTPSITSVVQAVTKKQLVKNVPTFEQRELSCLAQNIYHEALTESVLGKIAVAMVVLNRVQSKEFPNTICGVVYQPSRAKDRPRACQFSWTCDGKSDKIYDQRRFHDILSLSRDIIRKIRNREKIDDVVQGALYYHADYIEPDWAKYFERVRKIDNHVFYKGKS